MFKLTLIWQVRKSEMHLFQRIATESTLQQSRLGAGPTCDGPVGQSLGRELTSSQAGCFCNKGPVPGRPVLVGSPHV